MDSSELLQYLSLYLLSFVKLVLGSVPLAIAYIKMNDLSFIFSMIVCCVGGFSGVFLFLTLGNKIWIYFDNHALYQSYKAKNPSSHKSKRRLIYIRNNYGLWGIAFLSPVLLSVPVGCLLAARFYKDQKQIFLRMAVAITVWVWGSGLVLQWLF